MNEEQRLILKMLEEGKITASEAEALLNALGQSEETVEEDRTTDIWSKVEKHGEEFAEKVESAADRFARSLEAKTEFRLSDKLAKISKMISRFPFVAQEDTFEFTEEFKGDLAHDGDIICKLNTGNGRVSVKGWNEPGYRLRIIQRIRAKDRETALTRLHHIDIPDHEPLRELELAVPSFSDMTISLELDLPRTLIYQLDMRTHNGSITLADLYARTAQVNTSNGSVEIQGLQSERIECQTQNGSCRVDHTKTEVFIGRTGNGSYKLYSLQGERVECTTANGSIRVEPIVRGNSDYTLSTTNGSVKVDLGDYREVKTAFDMRTSVGRISVPEDGFEITQTDRQSGGWHLVGQSHNYDAGSNRLRLRIQTGSGSIRLEGAGGGQN